MLAVSTSAKSHFTFIVFAVGYLVDDRIEFVNLKALSLATGRTLSGTMVHVVLDSKNFFS